MRFVEIKVINVQVGVFTELRYGIILILSPGDHTFILIFSLSLPKVLERLIHSLVCSQLQIYKNICKPL